MEKVIDRTVLYMDNNTLLSYKNGQLLYENTNEKKFSIHLPLPVWKKICSHSRLTERFLRLIPKCVERIDCHQFLLSYTGRIFCLNVENRELKVEHHFCQRMNNPLYFTKLENIEGFTDGVVYGEYAMNMRKSPVSIYRRSKQGEWKKVFTFYNILHIHHIVPDKKRGCVYILTGDKDSESGIWEARNDFTDVKPIVIGEQKFRCCVAFPVNGGLLYATDTPLEPNAIYFLNFESMKTTLVKNISGACVYGREKNGVYYFATDVEPDSSLPVWRYWTTYKLGNGIKDRKVRIVSGNLDEGFNVIAEFRKDNWPYTLFQFGNVLFPKCDVTGKVLIQPIAVKKYDNIAFFL